MTLPKPDSSKIGAYLEEFDFSHIEILTDLGKKVDLNNWVGTGLSLLLKNDYLGKEEVEEDDQLDRNIKQQIEEENSYIEINSDILVSEVIRCCNILEFPTLYVIKKELVKDFISGAKFVN